MILHTLILMASAMTPEEAVSAALDHDPALAVAVASVRSAEGERRAAAGLRENPSISGALDVGGERWNASLTQELSLSGAGLADSRAKRASLAAAEAELARAQRVSAAEARRAWARLAAAEGVAIAAERERDSATAARAATARRREQGEASDLEVQLAQLDEARAVAGWLAALDERTVARAALVAITGDTSASAIGDPLDAAPALDPAGERADLYAAEARVEAARAAMARERAATLPPVSVGAWVEQDGDQRLGGPSLTVELPLWQRNADGRAQAEAALWIAEAEAASLRARAEAELRAADERIAALDGAASGLAPDTAAAAAAALAALDAAVAAGELDPIEASLLRDRVYAGERGWYTARLAEAEARIDAALARDSDSLKTP